MFPTLWLQPGVDALLVAATRARARCSKRRGDKALLCLDKSSVKIVQVKERGCVACVFVLISGTQRSLAHNVGSMKARSTAADPYQFLPQVFCIVLGCFPSVPSRVVIASASSHLYCPPMFPTPWMQPGVDALLVAATRARAQCSKRRSDKTLLC